MLRSLRPNSGRTLWARSRVLNNLTTAILIDTSMIRMLYQTYDYPRPIPPLRLSPFGRCPNDCRSDRSLQESWLAVKKINFTRHYSSTSGDTLSRNNWLANSVFFFLIFYFVVWQGIVAGTTEYEDVLLALSRRFPKYARGQACRVWRPGWMEGLVGGI